MVEEKRALLEGDTQLPAALSDTNTRDAKRCSRLARFCTLALAFFLTLIALTLRPLPIRHCQRNRGPRSIEERVDQILTETPLIGRSIPQPYEEMLIRNTHRRAQRPPNPDPLSLWQSHLRIQLH